MNDATAVAPVLDDQVIVRNIVSGAALACLLYESILTFEDERPVTFTKFLFCFTRYFALAFQVFNQYLMTGPLAQSSIDDQMCSRWFAFQTAGAQIQLWMVEVIMLLRVYALYNQTYTIGICLGVAFLAQIAVVIYASNSTFNQLLFDDLCIPTYTPFPVVYWCTSSFLFQLLVAFLTQAKKNVAVRDGWSTAPVLMCVTRDGVRVFVVICALLFTMVTYSFVLRVTVYFIFSWPMTILTVLGGRLILNMQRLQVEPVQSPWPILTTDFDTSTNINTGTAYIISNGGRINTHSTR